MSAGECALDVCLYSVWGPGWVSGAGEGLEGPGDWAGSLRGPPCAWTSGRTLLLSGGRCRGLSETRTKVAGTSGRLGARSTSPSPLGLFSGSWLLWPGVRTGCFDSEGIQLQVYKEQWPAEGVLGSGLCSFSPQTLSFLTETLPCFSLNIILSKNIFANLTSGIKQL